MKRTVQDSNLRAQVSARKHKWTVTCSRKNNPSIPIRNQDDDKNCQYNDVKRIKSTDSKHQMTRERGF